jgi:hypothetical protein
MKGELRLIESPARRDKTVNADGFAYIDRHQVAVKPPPLSAGG